MSAATSLYATIQQISLTMGVTLGAAVLETTMEAFGHNSVGIDEFTAAFIVVGLVSIASAPATLLMPRNAAEEMSGHT
jgi:hypothetical protein